MIEAGRYSVSADRVRALAGGYACDEPAYVDALAALTGGRSRGWWDEYREMLPAVLLEVAELERHASSIRVAVVVAMPGLVQTLDHARASFRQSVPKLLPHEIEHRASFRVKRQAVLHGDQAVPYTAIVHEAALRMGFAGPEVVREQLTYLIDMSERDNIKIVVIPFGRDDFPTAGQPISYLAGPVPQLDTVALDSDHGCDFLDAEAQLARYTRVLDRMEGSALSPAKSRDFMRKIAKAM